MKTTIGFSDKISVGGRQPWACCSFEIEVTDEMMDKPGLLHERLRVLYNMAEAEVHEQLDRQRPDPDEDDLRPGDPAYDRRSPPPPTPTSPRHASSSSGGPPRSARELGGWAKNRNLTKWFAEFGRANHWSGMIRDWSDPQAQFAYDSFVRAHTAPVPSTNGHSGHFVNPHTNGYY